VVGRRRTGTLGIQYIAKRCTPTWPRIPLTAAKHTERHFRDAADRPDGPTRSGDGKLQRTDQSMKKNKSSKPHEEREAEETHSACDEGPLGRR
jgi:hypothetical protein